MLNVFTCQKVPLDSLAIRSFRCVTIQQLPKHILTTSLLNLRIYPRKRNQNFPPVLMNGDELDTSASFTQFGLSLSSNLPWKTHIPSFAKYASQKLGFLARARGFFSSSHLLSIYKSQIRPSLEYCSHVWGCAPKSTLCLLNKVQSKAIRSSTILTSPNRSNLFPIVN